METMERAIKYLANKAHTTWEVKNYLQKKGCPTDEIEDVISNLVERKWLNDIEYSRVYVKQGLQKRRGLYRIKQELKNKGVGEFDLEDGIYEFEQDSKVSISQIEKKNAIYEAEKILKSGHSLYFADEEDIIDFNELSSEEKWAVRGYEKKLRDKIARKLNSLGYNMSLIASILSKYQNHF